MTRFALRNGEHPGSVGNFPAEELPKLARDNPGQAFVLSYLGRPGFGNFLQELEYKLYTPNTEANILLEVFIIELDKFQFVIAAFPLKDLERARELAKEFEIRIDPGTLLMFDKDGSHKFPMEEGPNTFIAQGTSSKLKGLSKAEQENIFRERELQLKHAYGVSAENDPPEA